jgi:hypothetical protein
VALAADDAHRSTGPVSNRAQTDSIRNELGPRSSLRSRACARLAT